MMFKKSHEKILDQINQQPEQAVRLGGEFFQKSAPATVAKHGESIVSGMIDAADALNQKKNYSESFMTATQAVGYSNQLPQAGAGLRERAFETMGKTIRKYTIINPDNARKMSQAAEANAKAFGSTATAALQRGINNTQKPESTTQTTAPVEPTMAPSPESTATQSSKPNTLNAVGSSPMSAPKKSGGFGAGAVKVLKTAAVIGGSVLLAQWASVHVLGNKESSWFGTTVTSTGDYNKLRSDAAWAQALTNTGAGLAGTIGMPRVTSSSHQADIAIARQEGRDLQKLEDAKPKGGKGIINPEQTAKEIHAFRLAHPFEFAEAMKQTTNNVAESLKTIKAVDTALGNKLTDLTVNGGFNDYRQMMWNEESLQKQDNLRAGKKPTKAPAP